MTRRSSQRGVGLLDGLIALAVLAFGMLSVNGLQARMFAQGTEAQNRLLATQLADELLNLARVDAGTDAPCYTVPAQTGCPASVGNKAGDWLTKVKSTLPVSADPAATLSGTQLTVTIRWTGRAVQGAETLPIHSVTRVTDVGQL